MKEKSSLLYKIKFFVKLLLYKIEFSVKLLLLPIKICFNFLLHNSCGRDGMFNARRGKIRKNIDVDILYIKKRFFESPQTIFGYSTLMLLVLVIPYTILWGLGRFCSLFPLWIQPETYYSISIGIVAFIVTIMLTLKLSVREIESGQEFINNLLEHCSSLNLILVTNKITDKDNNKKRILNIVTPNINLGAGTNNTQYLLDVIKKNRTVLFRFICFPIDNDYLQTYSNLQKREDKLRFFNAADQNNSPQLKYLYSRYYTDNDGIDKLDQFIRDLMEIMKEKNVVICKDKHINEDWENMPNNNYTVGYSSYLECTIGKYYDIGNSVLIKGELVKTQELIEHIDEYIIGTLTQKDYELCEKCKIKDICKPS